MNTAFRALWKRGLATPAGWRYVIGIVAALAASLLRIGLNPVWGPNAPFIFFFPATLFTALFAGLGPALVGIAVAGLMTFVWILPPIGTATLSAPVDFAALTVFVGVDTIVAWIGAAHRGLIEESDRNAASAYRLAAIVESSDDAIVSKTLNGVIMSWNGAAERIFGWTAAEAIGQHITLIIPRERVSEEDDVLARIRRGEAVEHFETVRVRKNGDRVDISLTVSPVRDAAGNVIGASKTARDVTERKRIEAERVELLRQAEAARAEAEAANRAKDDFLAVLSHELRTPLATIVTALALIRDICSGDPRASRAREAAERQADYLTRLVDDLLDMKKIISGAVDLQRQPCDLAQIVRECLTTLNEGGRFKNHALTVETEPAWVDGDAVRLQQILVNLVGNAVKYTPAGGSIRVSVTREEAEAVLLVQDSGIGIRPDLLPRMFDLFVQGEPASSGVRSGLGIGLAVVRRLVDLHGGTIQVSSGGPGKGSMFTVRLPRVQSTPS